MLVQPQVFQCCVLVSFFCPVFNRFCRRFHRLLLVEDLLYLTLVSGQIFDQLRVRLELVNVDVAVEFIFHFLKLDVICLLHVPAERVVQGLP